MICDVFVMHQFWCKTDRLLILLDEFFQRDKIPYYPALVAHSMDTGVACLLGSLVVFRYKN